MNITYLPPGRSVVIYVLFKTDVAHFFCGATALFGPGPRHC